jgi:hypothetical protein
VPFSQSGGIYAAIAYYYANKESLDAEFAAYDEECERIKADYLAGRRSRVRECFYLDEDTISAPTP